MLANPHFPDPSALAMWSGGFWMLLAKATIVLTAGVAITRSMYRASAGARHLVWLVVLGTLLVIPVLTTYARFEIHLLPPLDATSQAARPVSAAAHQLLTPPLVPETRAEADVGFRESDVRVVRDGARAAGPGIAMRGLSVIVAIWAAVVLMILISLGCSAVAVRRIVRRSRALEQRDWHTTLLEVSDRLGVGEPPRLLVSGDTRMPFACGVFTPTIVLPEGCETWSLERRRAVLLHEVAHVRRRDLPCHMLGRVACALYWFHPLVWTAAKSLRAESERACDDLALACGTRPTDYAEHLLDLVAAVRTNATPIVALAMGRRKEFEGRMLAILDPQLRHSTPSRRQSATLMASLSLSICLIAAAAPVPRVGTAVNADPARVGRLASHAEGTAGSTGQRPVEPHASEGRGVPVTPSVIAKARQEPRTVSPPATASADRAPLVPGNLAPATVHDTDHEAPDDRAALLGKVLRSDSSATLRRIAAWGLERYTDSPAAVDALVNAVTHDSDGRVREMAAWSLAESANHHDVADALSRALRGDANQGVRSTAAWALGTLRADASADALTAALSDNSPDVRARAAWALGNVEPRQAPAALIAMLGDKDLETRRLTAWALFQIADPADLPALKAALRTETDEETQFADIRAIAATGDESTDAIRGLLESPDARVKSIAVRALAGGDAMGPWPWPWPDPRPEP